MLLNPGTEHPRTWIATELYYPEATSTGHVMTAIAEHLATAGWDVRALTAQPTYSARGLRLPRRQTHNGVAIERVATTTLDKNRLLGRALNGLTLSVALGFRALRRFRRGDCVLVVTNPPTLPFVVLVAARIRGARCALLVHDVHPEQMVAVGMLDEHALPTRVITTATRWLFRQVDHVVAIGRDMAELATRKSDGRTPVTVVTNWADDELVQPRPKAESELLGRLGWTDAFVLQYAGNMGRPNAIESVLEAATLLRSHPRVRFLFAGSGAKRAWLERTVRERALTNVVVLDPVPRSEQTELLSACDAALIPLIPRMLGLGVPSRTYNALAAGRPILAIAHPRSEIGIMVAEERVGWVVPDDAIPQQLAKAIQDAEATAQADLVAMGARARSIASGKYARTAVLRRMSEVMATLRSTSGR